MNSQNNVMAIEYKRVIGKKQQMNASNPKGFITSRPVAIKYRLGLLLRASVTKRSRLVIEL